MDAQEFEARLLAFQEYSRMRHEDGQLLWTRSAFSITVIGAIVAGYGLGLGLETEVVRRFYLVILSLAGLGMGFAFNALVRGGRGWQRFWSQWLAKLEPELFNLPEGPWTQAMTNAIPDRPLSTSAVLEMVSRGSIALFVVLIVFSLMV